MYLKAALLARVMAAGFVLLAASCGGGGDAGGGSSQSPPASQPEQSAPASQPQQSPPTSQSPPATNPQQSQTGNPSDAAALYIAIDLHPTGHGGTTGSGIGGGQQVGADIFSHALLWRGTASSVVDLHPNGFFMSRAFATSGGVQVGSGSWPFGLSPTTNPETRHALKWTGSADSVVDLDPTGVYSEARGISGDQIVGYGLTPAGVHAFMWTSGGVLDLNPSGFQQSFAFATDGVQQVGDGTPPAGGRNHALLWTGSADSAVDLHPLSPAYMMGSEAWGVSGGQQVGAGGDIGSRHALLWTGSAQSVVDLHISGFQETVAQAVAAGRQVGWGSKFFGGTKHALLWNGTAQSVVDLHTFLPAGAVNSQAFGIDASGNVIGSADGHAILWVRQR
jgi:hypothetical protein